jgi:hypothetical protein
MIAIVRVPYLSEYNKLDVREEPIASAFAGYLAAIGELFRVYDFHLDRTLTVDTLAASGADQFVICVRGSGLHWKYVQTVARHLLARTGAKVYVYGQTGKLAHWKNPEPERLVVVPHDERALARAIGVADDGPTFTDGLTHYPYGLALLPSLGDRARLFKATIETTRGCHYPCSFCFINHGVNYSDRFARRSTTDVLRDMKQYADAGVSNFWFYDSEFLGADRSHYPHVTHLLDALNGTYCGDINLMIYSRADTLERYGDYGRLRNAGVRCALVGIESLDPAALRAMHKALSVDAALNAVRRLREHEIFCNLSFIILNRTSTLESIRLNIELLSGLYAEDQFIYLGQTMYFTYAFESDWSPAPRPYALSGSTKLSGSTTSTVSPAPGVTFDGRLEPLAEMFRILNYEQVRKLSYLDLLKEEAGPDLREAVHSWAAALNLFTLNMMTMFCDEFATGQLRLDTVAEYESALYDCFRKFNGMFFSPELAATITDVDGYYDGDWNGWERAIPSLALTSDA